MAKISTKNVKPTSAEGTPKTITPGNITAKINKIEVVPFPWDGDNKGLPEIILHLETKAIPGFTGFARDKDNPAAGNYEGQVGKVKAGAWPFKDFVGEKGTITKEQKMMSFLGDLTKALGLSEWFLAQDDKFETVEQLVQAMDTSKVFKDKFLNWCIAGSEYKNKQNYTAYNLYLPRFEYQKAPFEAVSTPKEKSKLIKFDPENSAHLYRSKKKTENVDEFGNDGTSAGEGGNDIITGGKDENDFEF
jgi:hypothetical protein